MSQSQTPAAKKFRAWRERCPEAYRRWADRRAAAKAKRGLHGSRRYRCGDRRAGWEVSVLYDGTQPVAVVAAHVGTTSLLGYAAVRMVGDMKRSLACRIAVAEARRLGVRLHALPGCAGIGGVWGLSRLIASRSV